jgi:hypothetical protein
MSQTIPAEYRDLFNKRAFASLGTTVRPESHLFGAISKTNL